MKSIMLPEVLKKLMSEKSTSARVVARDCGIPLSTLQTYIAGKKAAYNPLHLIKLAEYFGTSIDFLMTAKNDPRLQLGSIPTEALFEGWLKVKIERAVPSKSGKKPDD